MSNYTTQTAALKAVTIDTTTIDAKRIDTEKLFVNGELFDPSQIKESPNQVVFGLYLFPNYNTVDFELQSLDGNFTMSESLIKMSDISYFSLPDGMYAYIPITSEICNYISKNFDNGEMEHIFGITHSLTGAKFGLLGLDTYSIEPCILENYVLLDSGGLGNAIWFIKICEESDNLSELYGGTTEDNDYICFTITIPYTINDDTSSLYSLRQPQEMNIVDSLRQKIEEARQRILDKSAE